LHQGAGQVLTQSAYNGSTPLTSSYTYDGGDLTAITNPLGQSVLYFTDNLGRVAAVTDPLNNVSGASYDYLNRATQIGYGATSASPTAYTRTVNLRLRVRPYISHD
jgi:uncharacterized protein RhaS with RHS repeats